MRKNILVFLVAGFWLVVTFAYAQEQITITTYYPSPYGSYKELRADQMAIGSSYRSSTLADGNLLVSGNVGIGTTGPGAKLDVNGTARMTGFQLGTSATTGYVLTTNASGVGTWQAAGLPSGTAGQTLRHNGSTWVANSVIYNNGTNVGIGTTGPEAKLHVQTSSGNAIYGYSPFGYAIYGYTPSASFPGVYGRSGYTGVYGQGSSYGVYGYSIGGIGVYAEGSFAGVWSTGPTFGVVGFGTTTGVHGAGIGSATDFSSNGGEYARAGVWTNVSDRNAKENFVEVDGEEILEKINQLPITQWNFKKDKIKAKHIGPMGQDFYALFGLGDDDKHTSTGDTPGIALVGIKALNKKVKVQESEIKALEAQIQSLKKAFAKL